VKNAEFISCNDYVIRVYLNHRIRQTSGELNWSQHVSVPQQAASEMGDGLPQPACRSRLQTAVTLEIKEPWRRADSFKNCQPLFYFK